MKAGRAPLPGGLEIAGLGAWVPRERTLVIADIHIGIEEHLAGTGVLVPATHFGEVRRQLERLIADLAPAVVVIAGDIKHEFGTISDQEWRDTLRLIDLVAPRARLVLVRGNHDTVLGPIAGRRGVEVTDSYRVGSTLILHGDTVPSEEMLRGAAAVIIGHEHPALTVSDGIKAETYKCFLVGSWRRRTLVVLPSFNPLVEGTDILYGGRLSPLLARGIEGFEVVCVADQAYPFGTVRTLRTLLPDI
ncbi:metallophosphoesterase [Candidatus Woesearchaeota archaeon]|nr:metallophosphoesterase [Candidatus Woesearchaeota archaeon]